MFFRKFLFKSTCKEQSWGLRSEGKGGNEKKNVRQKDCTLKLQVTAKKTRHEVNMILKDTVTLLNLRLWGEFRKAYLVDQQSLIQFHG